MTATHEMKRIAEPSPQVRSSHLKSTFVATYYLLTVLTGAVLLFFPGRLAVTARIVASICFIAATVLLHQRSAGERVGKEIDSSVAPRLERRQSVASFRSPALSPAGRGISRGA